MKNFLVLLIFLTGASFAAAQIGAAPATDVLGAHLNYGRGCAACHAPHSGANGNGANHSGDTVTGNVALWGEDVGNLVGKTIVTGKSEHGSYSETLVGFATGGPEVTGLLTCLSCHDGNYAQGAMMKNAVYETLPPSYGTFNTVPTLLGNDGTGTGNYLNDHPVGAQAIIGCGGQYNWDCTISASGIITPGPNMANFVKNYGFFVKPGVINTNVPIVVCTTCHNQHLMNVVPVTTTTKSGLPEGNYATMFFVIGPYNPASTTSASNQTAQFCRQCHGGESNEMAGGTAGTTF
jgi:formate-dependent nitrite reductase cytochrome c552 subunit